MIQVNFECLSAFADVKGIEAIELFPTVSQDGKPEGTRSITLRIGDEALQKRFAKGGKYAAIFFPLDGFDVETHTDPDGNHYARARKVEESGVGSQESQTEAPISGVETGSVAPTGSGEQGAPAGTLGAEPSTPGGSPAAS